MDLTQLRELLQIVSEQNLAEVEIEQDGVKIVVRKNAPVVSVQPSMPFPGMNFGYPPVAYPQGQPAAPPAAPPQIAAPVAAPVPPPIGETAPETAAGETLVRAPIVGTFYRSPSPDAKAFIEVGDRVSTGDVLCIIEAMKLMNEIEAEFSGTVRKILVEDAQAVEYDQPLFVIEKA